jgi:hypothetical protein
MELLEVLADFTVVVEVAEADQTQVILQVLVVLVPTAVLEFIHGNKKNVQIRTYKQTNEYCR